MANNCLVTKLKCNVNNDTLAKLGEVPFTVSNATKTTKIQIHYSLDGSGNYPSARSTGSLYFYNASTGNDYGGVPNCQEVPKRSEVQTLEFKIGGHGKMFLKDLQLVDKLQITDTAAVDCSSIFCNAPLLTQLSITSGKLTGNIEDLSSMDFQELLLGIYDKPFDVAQTFGGCVNLENFTPGVDDSRNGYGTIESFVEAQLAAGRTSGTLDTSMKNSQVTLNGSHTPLDVGRVLIAYNGTSVTIRVKSSSALLATYSNGTWTYE